MLILLHTSKTMRQVAQSSASALQPPLLIKQARLLAGYLKTLSMAELQESMKLSPKLAKTTYALTQSWTDAPSQQRPAIDSFIGDIYSGLQVGGWSASDRAYANRVLRIVSGLYGILRPLDGIFPYRLELYYKLPNARYANLYRYWGSTVAATLDIAQPTINLLSKEYARLVVPFLDSETVLTPSFFSMSAKTKQPTFVAVHAKIARGAFAKWLITQRIESLEDCLGFTDLGYHYDAALSTPLRPVFICQTFGGLGLSVRLSS